VNLYATFYEQCAPKGILVKIRARGMPMVSRGLPVVQRPVEQHFSLLAYRLALGAPVCRDC